MDYTISLYYVEGINDVDTPFFSSKEEQSEYFSSKLIKSLSTSYYPPYYRNTIKFASDDLTLNTKVNYLSLNSAERTYYYFITSAMYVSEGILEITIDMDVIQTYYFDIHIKHCCIERKFINRYTEAGYYNRSYIRENVSQGHYLLGKNNYYQDNQGWYVVRYNKSVSSRPLYKYGTNDNMPSGSVSMFFPKDMKACRVDNVESTQSSEVSFVNLLDDPYVDSISYIPFDFMKGKYTIESNCYNFTKTYYTMYKHAQLEGSIPVPLYALTHLVIQVTATATSFTKVPYDWQTISIFSIESDKNTKTNVEYYSKYCPALIDENYQLLSFGENSTFTYCRLQYLKQPQVILKALVDLDTCNRIYGFSFAGSDDIDEPSYNTVVSTNNSLDLTLMQSQYRSWMSQNKNKLIGAMWTKLLTGA